MNKKYSFKRTVLFPASMAVRLYDLRTLVKRNNTMKKNPSNLCTLFAKRKRIENFRSLYKIYPAQKVKRKGPVFQFDYDLKKMCMMYSYNGKQSTLDEFLKRTMTTGFLAIKNDKIVNERYLHGNTSSSLNTSWSVTKSVISALVGIAIDEGYIKGVHEPIISYVPELKNSGYKNVSIKEVLQMSSGIHFNENYNDCSSDFYMIIQELFGEGQSMNQYVSQLDYQEFPRIFSYKSIDTQVLGMLITKATGQNPAQYLQEKIWEPLGMECDAFWNTDYDGNILAYSFLNATLKDFAKFGLLYLHNGNWKGKQIISQKWVRESVIPERHDLLKDTRSNFTDSYQYQWWIPGPNYIDGEFLAIGIWGQSIYINQQENLVIVKTSVDPNFEKHHYEMYTVYRAIADFLREEFK
ncbi:serine hydrolase [Bacillus sp. DX4.1]|uniref:serine hydrolase domain-containing protein n=1 Tax=Bacillus sp. DX4.1 TaxID=3055867 RepID=UPI0025A24E54|nr:serine hydrolase [Bacillus sp. DX4.1]MDM5188192.1 serine hydrolase [Bacillus sp. DX4.1]